ncbi:MAG: PAS domain S-box protein, partial [Bacteroidota bacterium]
MNSEAETTSYLLSGSDTGKLIYEQYKNEIASWPQHLHTSLSIITGSPLPMFLLWGNDKLFFYNDAFSAIVSFEGKHPSILGKDIRNSWPFLWDRINEPGSGNTHPAPVLLPASGDQGINDIYWNIHTSAAGIHGDLLLGILQKDVSPEAEARKIEDAEKKFSNIVNQSPIATSIFRGPEFIIEMANEQALALWGREASVIGKKIADVFPELQDQPYMKLLEDVYYKGLNYEGKENLAYLHKNGIREKVYVTFIYKPLHDSAGNITGILCMGYDVSDHVRTRDKILHAEERNNIALSAGNMGTFDFDIEKGTVNCSERFYHIFGVDPQTKQHNRIVENIHPDDLHIRDKAHAAGRENGNVFYEARIIWPDGSTRWVCVQGRYFFDDNKKPVHILGIIQDITDRKKLTQQIEDADKKFRETVKQAPIGIAIFTGDDYTCEMANDAYMDLIDKKEEDFLNRKLFDALPEVKPQVQPLFENIYRTGETFEANEFEVTLKRNNRYEQAFFNLTYQPLKDHAGKVNGILVIASEVTQQVLSKHAIVEREQKFSNIVMQSPIAMTIWRGPDYIIEIANEVLVETIWRKKREDVIGKKALEVFPELYEQKYPELLNKVYTEGITHREKESLAFVQGDDGLKAFYLDFEYSPLKEKDGSVKGIMITVSNVTDRVEARKLVEDAEARMRIAVEGTGTATWDLDLSTYEITHSPALSAFFGHNENIILKHAQMRDQLVEEDRINIVEPAFERALKTGVYKYESRVKWPDKSIHWIRTQGKVVYDEQGNPERMLGTMNEVTDRKEAEKASMLLAAIVQSTDDAIISKTTEGIVTSWNEGAERLFGYKADEMIGIEISKLFPQGYEDEEPKILSKLKQGLRVEHFETTRKHKSGRLIDVSLTISPIKDDSGNVVGASKIARDITEQKRIEKQIKDTQQQLEIVIEASGLGTWELNVQTSELTLSDRYLEITGGKQLENPTHENLKKLLHPEDLAAREKGFKDAFESGILYYETRLVWPDGSIHWVEARGKLFYDELNKPLRLIGTIRDITEERTYQQNLSLNEQRFRSVANTVPAMIWMVDTDKKYTFLNKSWLDFTGLSLEEENDGDFSKGIHPDDYENVVPAYITAFHRHEKFYFEYRLRRHDGAYRWISDTGTPQFNIDGIFEGYIGASMDVND